jgi:dUTP pyrophosphatase
MTVKFQKLLKDATLPKYAHEGDAGLDLFATDSVEYDNIRGFVTYDIGIAVEIPNGYVGLIFPRSSVYKVDLILSNCVGVIDSTYRGSIKFKFRKIGGENIIYQPEQAIGQLIIIPYPNIKPEWAFELSNTQRGDGGFGSTGN